MSFAYSVLASVVGGIACIKLMFERQIHSCGNEWQSLKWIGSLFLLDCKHFLFLLTGIVGKEEHEHVRKSSATLKCNVHVRRLNRDYRLIFFGGR